MNKIIVAICMFCSVNAFASKYVYDVSSYHVYDKPRVTGKVTAEDGSIKVYGYVLKDGKKIKVSGEFSGLGMVEVVGVCGNVSEKFELFIEE